MKTLFLCTILAALFLSAGRAEARIFEAQPNWWSSGRTCIASRDPAGLGWETSPPRACVADEQRVAGKISAATTMSNAKFDWLIAYEFSAKAPAKI